MGKKLAISYASVDRDGKYLTVQDTASVLNDTYGRELVLPQGQRAGVLCMTSPEGKRSITFPQVYLAEGMLVAEGANRKVDVFLIAPERRVELSDWIAQTDLP